MQRRQFIQLSTAGVASSAISRHIHGADAASKRVRVGVMGLGRGLAHVRALLEVPNVEIAALAEVDPGRLATAQATVQKKQTTACTGMEDFRKMLEDPQLDAVFIAAPNFWHTPAALLALQAGKHVYVEKPGSQNAKEAEMIVSAAKKYGKLVQMGNQRRTWMKEGIAALHGGVIGQAKFARATYLNSRKAVMTDSARPAPGFNKDLWQGPVPDDPHYELAKLVHYDWHWFWHWGNGELGNNGVHYLDILRWGLKVQRPQKISYTGGRYWHKDAQETPDSATVVYDCGDVGFEWTHSSCHPRAAEKPLGEMMFYGDGGTLALNQNSWTVYDAKGKEIKKETVPAEQTTDVAHIGNFIEAIRSGIPLNSPIEEGQKSALLCHWGNIAYRTHSTLLIDPATGSLLNPSAEATKLLGRPSHRAGWKVEV